MSYNSTYGEKERHKVIENALAEHGYFGVRKVVEND